jgi:hypothetical protein
MNWRNEMKNIFEKLFFGSLIVVVIAIAISSIRYTETLNEKVEAEKIYFQTQTEYQKLQIQYQKDIMETQKKIDDQMNGNYINEDNDCHH